MSTVELPVTTQLMLILCTNGAFVQPKFLITLLADESFRVPTEDFLNNNQAILTSVTDCPTDLSQLILDIFKSIAITFQPAGASGAEEVLVAKASDIAARMSKR